MAVPAYSAYSKIAILSPPKLISGAAWPFGVLRSKSIDTNISVHVGSVPPSCFGTGHVTVLSTPSRKAEYTGVLQHIHVYSSVRSVRSGRSKQNS